MATVLTLLTDFGTADGYAGAMLGAVLRIAPGLRVETITHGIPPHDIAAGSYWLAAAAPHFPDGTVHCAVVDPGVGSDRPLVASLIDRQLVVAPDNGLLHFIWLKGRERAAFRIDEPQPAGLSPTFHGRDLIGPLAARLAEGSLALDQLGPRLRSPHMLPELLPDGDEGGTAAQVVVVDRFGNLITAVTRTPWYSPIPAGVVLAGGRVVDEVVSTYSQITGEFALLWNSSGHLEIAGNQRSAARHLGLGPGDQVRILWSSPAEVALEKASV
jgi:S-adenosylmethionine hydrolase